MRSPERHPYVRAVLRGLHLTAAIVCAVAMSALILLLLWSNQSGGAR